MLRNLLLSALLSTVLLSLPTFAQFDNLVTTDDGGTLLFQSKWRISQSGDGNLSKIFRWDSHGFTTVFSPPNPGLITPPSATNPFVTGDGSIAGYVAFPGCSGLICTTTTYSSVLTGATVPSSLPPGALFQISRNGRYMASGTTVADRVTGAVQVAGSGQPSTGGDQPVGGRFGIGNNGGMLLLVLHSAFIFSSVDLVLSDRPGARIVNAPAVYAAVVGAAENRVVYEIAGAGGPIDRQLWSYDLASGQAALLEDLDFGTTIGASQYQPTISNDGMRLLYRRLNAANRTWEAVVRDYAAATTTVLGTMLPSMSNFTITGDGKSAWLHRSDGKLVRVAIDTLATTETTGRHVWVAQREGAAVYGSYNHLFGGGFAAGAGSGLPTDLSVDLSGLSTPILAATMQQLDVEIPWEAYPGGYSLAVHNTSSPFESVLAIAVTDLAPTFERGGFPGDAVRPAVIAHQDFRGLVTSTDPAVPGETVHLYMTGLGSLQPRMLTGQPASYLAYADQRPVCWLMSLFPLTQAAAPVAFAGIPPGMVGVYQVDVTIPPSVPPPPATLGCFDEGNSQGLWGDYTTLNIAKSM